MSAAFWPGTVLAGMAVVWTDPADLWLRLGIGALGGLWIWIRFGRLYVLFLYGVLIAGLAGWDHPVKIPHPQAGEYQIVQVRSQYAIARCKDVSVMVSHPEDEMLGLDWKVRVWDFEPIHSLNNPGLFSFQEKMADRSIEYAGRKVEVRDRRAMSLQGKVFAFLSARKARNLYLFFAYGISEQQNLAAWSALGLGVQAFSGLVRRWLSRFFFPRAASWLYMVWLAGMGFLFPLSGALLRLGAFGLGRCLFSSWSYRWSFSAALCLVLLPRSCQDLVVLLPVGISFLSHFGQTSWHRKTIQVVWSAFCQMACSQQVNGILLFWFMGIRHLFGLVVLASLPGLFWQSWGLGMEKILLGWNWPFDGLSIVGLMPFWYVPLLLLALLKWIWKPEMGRAIWLGVLLMVYPWIWRLDPFFHVWQLDVGQGDCAVVSMPFGGPVWMIDAAGRFNHDQASELYVPFLRQHQIDQLDALIISHADFDHDGSRNSLESQFPIRQIIDTYQSPVPARLPVKLLLPERRAEPEDTNDASLIAAFAWDGFSYLYTGDASVRIEKQLIEQYAPKADVFKLGHHGSSTSSLETFLQEVDPQLALISAGFANRYGHPHAQVLERLNRLGIDRLNTADHGQIHLFSVPGWLFWSTADGLSGCMKAR